MPRGDNRNSERKAECACTRNIGHDFVESPPPPPPRVFPIIKIPALLRRDEKVETILFIL